MKKESKTLKKRIRDEQEVVNMLDHNNEVLAGKLPVIEELEEERNTLLEEVGRHMQENEELKTWIE